ncbi:mitochondrial 54S ribosomal protein YmL40 [Maudiozyma humilis]|uniref:Mitochondrial 54S ribosomal protein YmL40 n=1 Tax=Maudiozyma humilis TaxID=51915 RepID=A0AAV5RZ77_MAUHU|nr:mitochondrial 54S ribosomal protein YmL40 [Kazachstania humilis]
MSINFKHISKAGARIMERLANPPKGIVRHQAKEQAKALPEFLQPDLPILPREQRFRGPRDWRFMPGDRVVVLHGEAKGNIARVTKHDTATNGFILDEFGPTKTVAVPKDFWTEGQTTHMVNLPVLLRQRDLRLVAEVEDPADPTGATTKTVAVANIVYKGQYYDEDYKRMMPYRCVFGQPDLIIPWPRPEPVEDGPLATDSEVAREQTFWVDSIARGSIPQQAFVTIRNPHSKHRRGTITPADLRKLVAPDMPLTETKKAYLEEQKMLHSRPKPVLTDADKQMIGDRVRQFMEAGERK